MGTMTSLSSFAVPRTDGNEAQQVMLLLTCKTAICGKAWKQVDFLHSCIADPCLGSDFAL